jgi:hypothetical protein
MASFQPEALLKDIELLRLTFEHTPPTVEFVGLLFDYFNKTGHATQFVEWIANESVNSASILGNSVVSFTFPRKF